jgi:DNA-binding NarL/FixJ family response regulator
LKFLVADDHQLIREGLRYALEGVFNDLLIVEAMDGAQVLDAVSSHPDLDLILLDYFMPGMDGFTLVSELCENRSSVPVIILSGSSDPLLMHRLLDCGASGFISKTTDHEVIMDALRLVLAGGIYIPSDFDPPARRPAQQADAVCACGCEETGAGLDEIQLTQRQQQVLRLMAEGKTNKDISRVLSVSENTIKVHVTAVLKALCVSNRTQAVLAAQRLGLAEG